MATDSKSASSAVRALRRKMFAAQRWRAVRAEPRSTAYAPEPRRYNEEFLFGEIWRGGSIALAQPRHVAVLAVLGRATELRLHIRPLNNGSRRRDRRGPHPLGYYAAPATFRLQSPARSSRRR